LLFQACLFTVWSNPSRELGVKRLRLDQLDRLGATRLSQFVPFLAQRFGQPRA
jgi:hypothetical protein